MSLTDEEEQFLEECESEFSERFTDSEPDYKRVYDKGIPQPPVIFPWCPRSRYNNRDRGSNRRDNRNWDGQNRSYGRQNRHERQFAPY